MSAACPSLLVFALAGSSFVSATSALAGTITATDAGFVTMAGGSAKGDGTIVAPATYNYSVGFELHYSSGFLFSPLAPMDRKNYFVFDLSDIDAPIVSATLMLYAGVYESTDPFEVFELVAPGDPMDALTAASFLLSANATGPSAFDDPGDPTIATAADLYGNIAQARLCLPAR